MNLNFAELAGLFGIPALVGALSGWIYWLAAGRPEGGEETRK
jgi:hypothetical protein